MENVDGHIKFQNHYSRVHVQLTGNCKMWRSESAIDDGGWLSTDVFVDIIEQKWHANLKVTNLFVPVRYMLTFVQNCGISSYHFICLTCIDGFSLFFYTAF